MAPSGRVERLAFETRLRIGLGGHISRGRPGQFQSLNDGNRVAWGL